MRIAKFVMLIVVSLAGAASAQNAPPPAAPKPCVTMPRQGPAHPPVTGRPRDRCAMLAFPRLDRAGR